MRVMILTLILMVAQAAHATVTATDLPDRIVLKNQRVAVEISKTTTWITSLKYKRFGDPAMTELGTTIGRTVYLDINTQRPALAGTTRPAADYVHPKDMLKSIQVVTQEAHRADVKVIAGPSATCPFEVEFHYVMCDADDAPGVYAYSIFRHRRGMAGGDLVQTRFVVRGREDASLFTHHIVDDRRMGPYPTSKVVDTLQDSTDRLADGSVYTKYDMSQFTYDYQAQGMAGGTNGKALGLWIVWPALDCLNGGPLRQDLTVHKDNIMQSMFQSAHFGAPVISVKADEEWSKVFGPVMIYVNEGQDVAALWKDAQARTATERGKGPYAWVADAGYTAKRSMVRGRVRLTDGKPTEGAWAVLSQVAVSEEQKDYALRAKGYSYWTHVDRDGRFEIGQVRPGSYTLFISGADQFVDFRKEDVAIAAGAAVDLGELLWTPVSHGARLWQIGVADRSAAEFRDGAEPAYRNYDTFKNYFRAFPNDVDFVIGKSHEKDDWNFAQWSWFNKSSAWTVHFNSAKVQTGKATLTIGLTATYPAGALQVRVNGTRVGQLTLPRTGAAAYRSGAADSVYTVKEVTFDAALIKPGQNEMTLSQTGATLPPADADAQHLRPRAIMWDALRLEVDANGP